MPYKILVVMEKDSWVNLNIACSLELMGHTVYRFYFGEYVGEFYGRSRRHEQAQKNRDLVEMAKSLKSNGGLDLIFCYVFDDFLLPEYAKQLSVLAIPMVNYNVDMAMQWFRQIRTARYFDLMLCAQPTNMNHLARYSRDVLYFPMAASYSVEDPSLCDEFSEKHEITFLGTGFPLRQRFLSELTQAKIPVTIYGKNWNESCTGLVYRNIERTFNDIIHYSLACIRANGLNYLNEAVRKRFSNDMKKPHAIISNEYLKGKFQGNDISNLFRASKINIGLTRYDVDDPNRIGKCQMKLRDFEVPMMGGFYLVEKAPGYENEFIDEKEVVTWRTLPELIEKIKYFLEHDNKRKAIAQAGWQRAMKDHTWEVRFNGLFKQLGL